jgi:hypothetical protein
MINLEELKTYSELTTYPRGVFGDGEGGRQRDKV